MSETSGIPPQGPQDPNQMQKLQQSQQKTKPASLNDTSQTGHKYLGMTFSPEQWAKFQAQMESMISSQIKDEENRMLKALKKFQQDDNN